MKVAFQGIDRLVVTFEAGDTLQAGEFASMSGSGSVGRCSFGESPVGLVLGKRDGYAAVQVRGYVEAGYTGALTPGWTELTAEQGKVRAVGSGESGRRCLVVSTDAAAKTAGLFLC